MAINFTVSTTDSIDSAFSSNPGNFSLFARLNPLSNLAGRRIYNKNNWSSVTWQSGNFRFLRNWSSGNGQWDFPAFTGSAAICLRYSDSSDANIPSLFRDGFPQSVTVVTSPIGTPRTSVANLIIGNVSSANLQSFEGIIQDFAIWDAILPDTIAASLTANRLSPLFWPHNLIYYNPLENFSSRDTVGGLTPTFTGTSVVENLRMNRRQGIL